MRRFFLPERLAPLMTIEGEDAHHISRVLRMGPGDELVVADAGGECGLAEIVRIGAAGVELELKKRLTGLDNEPPMEVILIQALPKAEKMDYIVQKAVELGVTAIAPAVSDHCVVRYDGSKRQSRVERWRKIAREAAKQCGRNIVPRILPIQDLPDIIESMDSGAAAVMLYEGRASAGLKEVLARRPADAYYLLIGPEGGFSAAEVALCQQKDIQTATMGPRIMRTETAAIAAITAVLYHYGDLGGAGRPALSGGNTNGASSFCNLGLQGEPV